MSASQTSSPNQPSSTQRDHKVLRIALWAGAIVGILTIACALILSINDWNWARGRIAAIASSKLNREVKIEGPLTAHLLSSTPSIHVEGLKITSPDWTKENDFAKIEKLNIALNLRALLSGNLLLETLEIDNPHIAIVQEDNRNNFTFGNPNKNKSAKPPKLPGVKRFTLRGGEVNVIDQIHKLNFVGTVEANENSAKPEAEPFRLRGHGELNAEPFELDLKGGPLANLKMDEPYNFDADVTAGKTHASAHGSFKKPFDVAQLTAALDVKGDNLAHLYYLTNLSLPFTPPYHFSGTLQTSKQKIYVHEINSTVGKSDVQGEVTVDLASERVRLNADLKSKSLNLADLSPAVGKGVPVDPKTGATLDNVAPEALPPDKLFPTYKFEFDRLRTMDADVNLHADSVQTQKVPIQSLDMHLQLNDGVLVLDPIVFTLSQGKLAGNVHLDARDKIATTKLDVRITGVNLEQFKGKKMPFPPLAGILHTRAQLDSHGNSIHDMAANANGTVTAVVPHGEIRQAFAELTGINVARGLGLLISKDQDKSAIRCGVATFKVQNGDAQTEQVVFDTDTVLIKGEGKIDLNTEALDLDIAGQPKKLRLLRLRSPVNVRGTLRKPAVSVDAAKAAAHVGVAAALSALLTPLAAALTFIDPGLAKDADCAALLAEAEQSMPKKSANATTAAEKTASTIAAK